MTRRTRFAPLVPLFLVTLVAALLPLLLPSQPAEAAVATVTGQSTFVPLSPSRVLDTRTDLGGHQGVMGSGETFDLTLSIPAEATAVVLNVTATQASTETVIRVYPTPASGAAVPTVSNLNVVAGVTVADQVTSRIGAGRAVRLRNDSGTTHLVVDLAGYYVAGGSGSGFVGTAPKRLLDTRLTSTPLGAGQPRTVDLSVLSDGSPSGVPADATAVVFNYTAVQPTGNTVLRAYPGSAVPTVSNLNPPRGSVVANLTTVAVDTSNGRPEVTLLNGSGRVDVVLDLAGWYVPDRGDVFHPVDPYRVLDTRSTDTPVPRGTPRNLQLAGVARLPFLASSVVMTVTAVKPSTNTYVAAYPAVHGDSTPPRISNLNLLRGQVVPNAAVVATGDEGFIRLSNYAGTSDLVVDVGGWFGPAAEGYDISWPQCTPSRTSDTSRHPDTGGFAVIGLTNGKPYTTNACLADEFAWAKTLPGGGAGYIILNAPGAGDPNWGTNRSPQACDGTTSVGCAYDYGWWAVDFALPTLPATKEGGRPQVWLDVEGPYSSGPVWQDIRTAAGQAVNAAVVRGAYDRLRAAGLRTGFYSRRMTTNASGTRTDDWYRLTGNLALRNVQQWVFPRPTNADEANNPPSDSDKATLADRNCTDALSFTGGFIVLSQYQNQVNGTTYDVNHAC